jgi:hypothetical protein
LVSKAVLNPKNLNLVNLLSLVKKGSIPWHLSPRYKKLFCDIQSSRTYPPGKNQSPQLIDEHILIQKTVEILMKSKTRGKPEGDF